MQSDRASERKIKFFILQINDCLEHASEFESEKTERMRRQNERRDLSGCVLIIVAEMKWMKRSWTELRVKASCGVSLVVEKDRNLHVSAASKAERVQWHHLKINYMQIQFHTHSLTLQSPQISFFTASIASISSHLNVIKNYSFLLLLLSVV